MFVRLHILLLFLLFVIIVISKNLVTVPELPQVFTDEHNRFKVVYFIIFTTEVQSLVKGELKPTFHFHYYNCWTTFLIKLIRIIPLLF